MDKNSSDQNNCETLQEKSLRELTEEHASLLRELQKLKIKFVKLSQEEYVYKKQEIMLKQQVYDLNDSIITKRKKLENVQRETEEIIKDTINRVNENLEKWECKVETEEEARQRKMILQERKERRVKYFKLKGEVGGDILFKEYQECIISELEKLLSNRSVASSS